MSGPRWRTWRSAPSRGAPHGGGHGSVGSNGVLDGEHFGSVIRQGEAMHLPEGSMSQVAYADYWVELGGHLPAVDGEGLVVGDVGKRRTTVVDQVVRESIERKPAKLAALIRFTVFGCSFPLMHGEEEGNPTTAR